MTTATILATRDITPRIGTEIRADKASTAQSASTPATIRELLEQRGVLVFPKIDFTDDEQIAFTETLGTLATETQGRDRSTTSRSTRRSTSRPTISRARCTGTSTGR